MQKLFIAPVTVSLLALAAVYLWGGMAAFALASVLVVLEVTLSIDNAVVNANVLEKMSPRWQKRFLTWGMAISVLGVRVAVPIFIVSTVSFASPVFITELALFHPALYGELIAHSRPAIEAFGGMFLFLVACGFFFDDGKQVHWLAALERRLVRWGRIDAIEIVLALALLLLFSLRAAAPMMLILESGLAGIILYLLMQTIVDALGAEAGAAAQSGIALFLYINVLDAAFSLDGVVGAFAITTLVPVIIVGLGIGAYFVRAVTLMLVRGGKLKELVYVEHGAHWAVFALALSMLLSLVIEVPEWFIATAGLVIIALSYLSSRRELRRAL